MECSTGDMECSTGKMASSTGEMERSTGEITEAVVVAVADATERDALSLPPLASSIDPDVLGGVVDGPGNGSVTFTYVGHEVTVTHDGDVTVSTVLPMRRARPRPRAGQRATEGRLRSDRGD
ncbi:HalOD1 output domain-containing protein [Halorubellus salinus]|uniref:HalOD1 output domain-containing protein n=1 Tax=Halorubellus salinus TaxID=755309 RepID=UPI001D0868DE|nr:HalOD1 output domain-containing protein [Halorubellus salinus]